VCANYPSLYSAIVANAELHRYTSAVFVVLFMVLSLILVNLVILSNEIGNQFLFLVHPFASQFAVSLNQTGRVISQVVSRRLPTASSRPSQVMWGFEVNKVALGQVFSEYFGFPGHAVA
jgi:hypothetical protein